MTKAINVGLHTQPYSSLRWHADAIAALLPAPDVVPSMTENTVRYEQGKQAVVDYVQEQSQNRFSEGFNEAFIIGLCKAFPLPTTDWRTPMADIMYCAGVKYALDTVVRYYNDELGAK